MEAVLTIVPPPCVSIWAISAFMHSHTQGGGTIVNTASIAGLVGGFGGAYSAAKHGVVGLTRVAALEYATRGIRVNAVCPGGIRTPMLERVNLVTQEFDGTDDLGPVVL